MSTTALSIDESKLNAFMNKVIGELGGAWSASMVIIGDKLGLYKAMTDSRPVTSQELAQKTNTNERYIREWLANQAAGGYLTYDSSNGKYYLPPEHAMALANEDSPAFVVDGFQMISVLMKDEAKIVEAFRTGKGVDWGDHDPLLYTAVERFFKPNYVANITSSWIPALDGGNVEEKLKKGGAKVADVGCGHGIATIIMAKAYPNSKFVGFDNHTPSIEYARKKAKEEELDVDRITFEVSSAANFPKENEYDLVAFFDCLHDMGDPAGAALVY